MTSLDCFNACINIHIYYLHLSSKCLFGGWLFLFITYKNDIRTVALNLHPQQEAKFVSQNKINNCIITFKKKKKVNLNFILHTLTVKKSWCKLHINIKKEKYAFLYELLLF